MAYGTIKVDNITFDNGGVDKLITVSGLFYSTSGALTVTGAISGGSVTAPTATFTTLTGTTTAGTTATFTSGSFTSLTGVTTTVTSGIFALGSAAAPSITISGDLNTGIYSPGADQLAIATAGTGRLFVTSAGKVGVGEPSVQANLHVAANISDATALTWANSQFSVATPIAGNSTANRASIYFAPYGSDNNYAPAAISVSAGTSGASTLKFFTNSSGNLTGDLTTSERMRIDSSGNLGLGVVPSAWGGYGVIQLNGGSFSSTGTGPVINQNSYYDGTNWKYIANGYAGRYEVKNASGHIWYNAPSGTAGNTISFTQAMTLDASGNLGVATINPGDKLHVSGSIRADVDLKTINQGKLNLGSNQGGGAVLAYNTNGNLDIAPRSGFSTVFLASDGGTERARIDSSGRLLVGTSSARANLYGSTYNPTFQLETSAGLAERGMSLCYNGGTTGGGSILALITSRGTTAGSNTIVANGDELGGVNFLGTDGIKPIAGASVAAFVDGTPGTNDMPGRLVFSTTADGAASSTERMRISSTGMCSINTSLAENTAYFDGKLRVVNSGTGASFSTTGAASAPVASQWHQATTGDNLFTAFGTEAAFALRGSITYNRAGGVVAYNTTSDYRSKTILGSLEDTGTTIDAFKIYRGLMNGATIERPMLIAHEAQEVAPYCVTGQKDAEDDNGNPIYQQMDHQVLVPLLIAEIQQLRIRVAALESA
jgi:hypothetical protein